MKTRDAAKALYAVARLLDTFPNVELSNINNINIESHNSNTMSNDMIAVNLNTLIRLSAIDKQQWINFARDNNLNIDFRQRDASRDILGKILKYIEKNPEAQKAIESKATKISGAHSAELTNALRLLLGN